MSDIKKARFKKVAEKRVNKIIQDFRLLGNCSNKSNYIYSDEDAQKIINTLAKEFKKLKDRFQVEKNKEKFRL
jgi:Zn-finger protein